MPLKIYPVIAFFLLRLTCPIVGTALRSPLTLITLISSSFCNLSQLIFISFNSFFFFVTPILFVGAPPLFFFGVLPNNDAFSFDALS